MIPGEGPLKRKN